MSYNITGSENITLDAWMYEADRARLAETDDGPEISFLEDGPRDLDRYFGPIDAEGRRKIKDFAWSCGGSGNAFHDYFPEVAKHIHGRLEVVLIWEGGDSVSGLRVVDGVMTQPKVVYALEAESGPPRRRHPAATTTPE